VRHVQTDPVPLGQVAPGLPAALAEAVDRALSRSPDRTDTAAAFAAAVCRAADVAWGTDWHRGTTIAVDHIALAHARPAATAPSPPGPPVTRPGPPITRPGQSVTGSAPVPDRPQRPVERRPLRHGRRILAGAIAAVVA